MLNAAQRRIQQREQDFEQERLLGAASHTPALPDPRVFDQLHPHHRKSSSSWGSKILFSCFVILFLAVAAMSIAAVTIAAINQNKLGAGELWARAGFGPPPEALTSVLYYLDLATGAIWYGGSETQNNAVGGARSNATPWKKISVQLSGDVSGTTDAVIVKQIGNVSTDYVINAANLVYQNATGGLFNGSTLDLTVNSLKFPASGSPDSSLIWVAPGTLNLTGILLVNQTNIYALAELARQLAVAAQQTANAAVISSGLANANSLPRPNVGDVIDGAFVVFNSTSGDFVDAAPGMRLLPNGTVEMFYGALYTPSIELAGRDLEQWLRAIALNASQIGITADGVVFGPASGSPSDQQWQVAVFNSSSTSSTISRSSVIITPSGLVSGVANLTTTDLVINGTRFDTYLYNLYADLFSRIPPLNNLAYGPGPVPNVDRSVAVFTGPSGKDLVDTPVKISHDGIMSGVQTAYVTRLFLNGVDIIQLISNSTSNITFVNSYDLGAPLGAVPPNSIVLFDGPAGNKSKHSVVTISDQGVMTNVSLLEVRSISLNGSDLYSLIQAATGEQDLSGFVTGPASSVNSTLSMWVSGTGRNLVDTAFVVSGRNLSNIGVLSADRVLVNGLDVTTLIQTAVSGLAASQIRGPSSGSVANSTIVLWSSTTGLNVTDSPFVVAGRNLSGIGSLSVDRLVVNNVDLTTLLAGATNEQDLSSLVSGPTAGSSVPIGCVAVWNSTTGRALSCAPGVSISPQRDLTGLETLSAQTVLINGSDIMQLIMAATNETDISRLITGPTGSVTADSLMVWDTASGRLAKASSFGVSGSNLTIPGVLSADSVVVGGTALTSNTLSRFIAGPASGGVTDSTLLAWNSTSGTLVRSTTLAVSGNNLTVQGTLLTSALTVNGAAVDPTSYVRGPAGATTTDALAVWDSTNRQIKNSPFTSSGNNLDIPGTATVGSLTVGATPLTSLLSGYVSGPAGAVTDSTLLAWNSTSGRLVKSTTVQVTGNNVVVTGSVTSASLIVNGVTANLGSYVAGPSGAVTDSAVALWDTTSGRLTKNSVFTTSGPNMTVPGSLITPDVVLSGASLTNTLSSLSGQVSSLTTTVAGLAASTNSGIRGPATTVDSTLMAWNGTTGSFARSTAITTDGNSLVVPGTLTIGGGFVADSFTSSGNVLFLNSARGVVIPSVNTTTRLTISGVAENQLIFDNTLKLHYFWADGGWNSIPRTITRIVPLSNGIAGTLVTLSGIQFRYTANAANGNIEYSAPPSSKNIRWSAVKYSGGVASTVFETATFSVPNNSFNALSAGGLGTNQRIVYSVWDLTAGALIRIELTNAGTTLIVKYELS